MQIRKIDGSTQFGNKYVQKIFKGKLKDDSMSVVRLTLGNNKQVKAIECYQWDKNGEFINGIGYAKNNGVRLTDLVTLLKKLQKNAYDHVDFIGEFTRASKQA